MVDPRGGRLLAEWTSMNGLRRRGRRLGLRRKASLAAEIVMAYVITRWQMSHRDVRWVVAAARRQPPRRATDRDLSPEEAWRTGVHLGRVVDRTLSVLPTDARCLAQSLVLSRLLASRGIPVTLVIGARPEPTFAAHAWIEFQGRALLPVEGFGDSRLLEL